MPYTYYGDDRLSCWPRGIIFPRFALNLVQVLLQSAWNLSIIIYANLEELVMEFQARSEPVPKALLTAVELHLLLRSIFKWALSIIPAQIGQPCFAPYDIETGSP
jgi:hypothetical protein